jgi:hypothetical protein
LKMPTKGVVSDLKSKLLEARRSRDEKKVQLKQDSSKIKTAQRKNDRVKQKAASLNNNDLYQVFLMRMETQNKHSSTADDTGETASTSTGATSS